MAKPVIPQGFVLDEANTQQTGLPSGFVLDEPQELSQPRMSMGEAAFTTATNPLGFGDEIKAGIAAGVAKLFGGAATQNIDIGDLYREARTAERAKLEKARQERPLTSFAGQVFSDVGVAGKSLKSLGLAEQGMGAAVKGGAALGGASALGETEDLTNIPQTIKDVATGAVAGGVVGGAVQKAIPAAQSAVGAISQAPKKALQKMIGVKPEAVKTFQELGIDPTLADVSSSAGLQNFIKDIPVAGKPITEALQKQVNDISSQIQGVVKSSGGTYEQAGAIIKKGAENYVAQTEHAMEGLYGELGRRIGDKAPTPLNSTLKYINDDVGLLDTMSIKKGGTLQNTVDTIKSLTQDTTPNYERIRKLRSKIRREKATMVGDERREMETLYDHMTNDMKESIKVNGGETALKLFDAANKVYAKQKTFINDTLQPLIDAKLPEQVYSLATRGAKMGGTRISEIMKSLKEPQKDFLRATFIRDLGLAQKGAQGAEADVFSPQKFMAEYSILKKNGVEKHIFTPEQVTAYNRLNKVVELTRNTEQAGKKNMLLPTASLLSVGIPTTGIGLIPLMGGGRFISSQMMTNPAFINWLAVTAQATPKELPKQLNRLSAITAANPEIREGVLQLLSSFGVNDAEANDGVANGGVANEEQFKKQLLEQKQKYGSSLASDINVEQEVEQYKKRYLK